MALQHATRWRLLVFFVFLTACNIFVSPAPTQDLTSSPVVHTSLSIDKIPIPDGAKIQGRNSTQLSFFVPKNIYKSRSELFAFYRQKLPELGWKLCEIQECILPTPTDTEIETYRYGTGANELYLQIGVNLMIDNGIQVTLWLIE